MSKRNSRLTMFLWLGALSCLLGGGYLVFELGRYSGGFAMLDVRRSTAQNLATIAYQAAEIVQLQRQVAILETALDVDRETYSQVEENLASLQAQIQAQNEEIAFYQGIISPENGESGLRVQNLEIESGGDGRNYLLRLVLVQAIVHSQSVTGSVRLTISGLLDGSEVEYDLPSVVAAGGSGRISYDFRYFQTIERAVVLPQGFLARSVEIEISQAEPRGEPIVRSFQWVTASG